MAYIWEHYSTDKSYQVSERISPYIETINADTGIVCVNPLLRFSDIFIDESVESQRHAEKDVVTGKLLKSKIKFSQLENIFFHYLAQLDMLKGINKKQIKINFLNDEIVSGNFGIFVKEHWENIKRKDKEKILCVLLAKCESGMADNFFFLAAQKLFDCVSIVCEKNGNTYYVYVNENTSYNHLLMDVILELFGNFRCRYETVWRYHYGIIGVNETMEISEIQIM